MAPSMDFKMNTAVVGETPTSMSGPPKKDAAHGALGFAPECRSSSAKSYCAGNARLASTTNRTGISYSSPVSSHIASRWSGCDLLI